MDEIRYCLVADDSGHDYVIPVDRFDEWYEMSDNPNSQMNKKGDPPDWAKRVNGRLTFADPQYDYA